MTSKRIDERKKKENAAIKEGTRETLERVVSDRERARGREEQREREVTGGNTEETMYADVKRNVCVSALR